MTIRKAAVAGYFYPDDPETLRMYLDGLLSNNGRFPQKPKCLIVPHAGYIYSGIVAASVYAPLKDYAKLIQNIVITGPSHRFPLTGVGLSGADYFETPLGRIAVNQDIISSLVEIPGVKIHDEAHQAEHSIEVQLPFLQYILGNNFKIIPMLSNSASPGLIGLIYDRIWDFSDTLFIISTDLSHYLSYDNAVIKDKKTCEKIQNLNIEGLNDEDACGNSGVRGILSYLKSRQMSIFCVDYRNSGDTQGDRSRVVGYAAFYA